MRFQFDPAKSKILRMNVKRGIGFEEAKELFKLPHYVDQRSELPEQSSATGWVNGILYTVIFEVREDEEGEFYWLVTLWKATPRERLLYVEHA